MDTMELMNGETMETVADTATNAVSAISEAAANVIPEIRYVEVPVEGTASLGSFVAGICVAALTTIGVYGGRKLYKKLKGKKNQTEDPKQSESLEGYERKTEEKTEQQAAEQKPEEKVEIVKGEVVNEKKPEKK